MSRFVQPAAGLPQITWQKIKGSNPRKRLITVCSCLVAGLLTIAYHQLTKQYTLCPPAILVYKIGVSAYIAIRGAIYAIRKRQGS